MRPRSLLHQTKATQRQGAHYHSFQASPYTLPLAPLAPVGLPVGRLDGAFSTIFIVAVGAVITIFICTIGTCPAASGLGQPGFLTHLEVAVLKRSSCYMLDHASILAPRPDATDKDAAETSGLTRRTELEGEVSAVATRTATLCGNCLVLMHSARQGSTAHRPSRTSHHGSEVSRLGSRLVRGHVRWIGFLTERHHNPREACTELTMWQLAPNGFIKVDESLEDIDLPETKTLRKVAHVELAHTRSWRIC